MTTDELALVASFGGNVVRALRLSLGMAWEIIWALILGFTLSAIVQSLVSKLQSAHSTENLCSVPRGTAIQHKQDSNRTRSVTLYLPKWLGNANSISGRGGS